MHLKNSFRVLACVGALFIAACGDDDETENNNNNGTGDSAPTQTIAEIAAATPELSTLVDSLSTAQAELLGSEGEFTVFAPTNDAFTALLALVPDPSAILEDVVNYHVIAGDTVTASDVVGMNGMSVGTALSGSSIDINVYTVGSETVVALNGVIQVTTTDILATNGVVHLIDGVLLPEALVPEFPGTTLQLLTTYPIFSAIAGVAGDLTANTVVDALADADGALTLFAPINPAVNAVAPVVDILPDEDVEAVVLYHAVLGTEVAAADIVGPPPATSQTMASGQDIAIDTSNGVVLNGTINVVYTDVVTSNGIVHIIDGVLLPPTE